MRVFRVIFCWGGGYFAMPMVGMDCGMDWNGLERTGMDWDGLEWTGMNWNGLERNGMDWNRLEWTEMDWDGLESQSQGITKNDITQI